MLTFTKIDVFEKKVSLGRTLPPKELFPYEGDPTDVPAVRDVITKKFMDTSSWSHSDMPISYIDARDTEQVKELLARVQTCAKERIGKRRIPVML
jgi:hypothetical protein